MVFNEEHISASISPVSHLAMPLWVLCLFFLAKLCVKLSYPKTKIQASPRSESNPEYLGNEKNYSLKNGIFFLMSQKYEGQSSNKRPDDFYYIQEDQFRRSQGITLL